MQFLQNLSWRPSANAVDTTQALGKYAYGPKITEEKAHSVSYDLDSVDIFVHTQLMHMNNPPVPNSLIHKVSKFWNNKFSPTFRNNSY